MIVRRLADEQQAAVVVEYRAADADLGRRVTGLGLEQRLDPGSVGPGVRGHDARAQTAQRLIAFPVMRILGVGQAGLRRRQQLARPEQPVGFGVQIVGSVTSAGSETELPWISMSASVNVRQVPEISTSDGRNRAL